MTALFIVSMAYDRWLLLCLEISKALQPDRLGWDCEIQWCITADPPSMTVLDTTLNNLIVRLQVFVAASHQTRLDTRSKARRPIKVGIKGRGRSVTSRDSNPACLCCSSALLVQCEPDEASSFTNPNVGPGTYAS